MDDILGLSRPKPTGDAQRIKKLVRERFSLNDDITIMASELHCHEDGCPDVETVIAVMSGPDQRETWKIAKPMTDIAEDDIRKLA
jgi:hypothetical protein